MSKNSVLTTCFPSRLVRRGSVEIDLQDHALRVQRRKYLLEPSHARLLAVIMDNSRYGAHVHVNAVAQAIGYNCHSNFQRALGKVIGHLSTCDIANAGGVNSAFDEPTIYADALFERDGQHIKFNAFLAGVINSTNCVAESNLARMRGEPVHCTTAEESIARLKIDNSSLFSCFR